jgi:hypothetical protein
MKKSNESIKGHSRKKGAPQGQTASEQIRSSTSAKAAGRIKSPSDRLLRANGALQKDLLDMLQDSEPKGSSNEEKAVDRRLAAHEYICWAMELFESAEILDGRKWSPPPAAPAVQGATAAPESGTKVDPSSEAWKHAAELGRLLNKARLHLRDLWKYDLVLLSAERLERLPVTVLDDLAVAPKNCQGSPIRLVASDKDSGTEAQAQAAPAFQGASGPEDKPESCAPIDPSSYHGICDEAFGALRDLDDSLLKLKTLAVMSTEHAEFFSAKHEDRPSEEMFGGVLLSIFDLSEAAAEQQDRAWGKLRDIKALFSAQKAAQ